MPRRILLADDSVTAQNMGKKILSDAGYEVITVSNGSAALKKANELLPDIVVLDVYMPGYSGLEVCKLLKENAQTAEIPILLTVGKLEPFKSEEALKARANAFVVKPFEATELLAVIRKIEDANAKPERKPSKMPKASAAARAFAGSGADSPEAQETGFEEKGWKNRLGMPAKKKAEPEPEQETQEMGTEFRDLTSAPGEESGLRRESAFTSEAVASSEAPLEISPEEIAAIKAAVEVLSGEGDNAPVLHVPAAEGLPRHLAPEPEEAPEEAVTEVPQVSEAPRAAHVVEIEKLPEPVSVQAHWVAVAADLTQVDSAVSLEREMQEAQGTVSAPEKFNTYSLANFADSAVAEPVDDEPILSEAAAQASVVADTGIHIPATALAASASGDAGANSASAISNSMPGSTATEAHAGLTGIPPRHDDLGAAVSSRNPVLTPEIPAVDAAPKDASAPEDEIDSRTKSQMDAAWSNWQEIRSTIVTPNLTEQLAEVATAVAQEGAVQPANGGGHDSASIASIVDSVLAEMRPKLVEEIARKLAAKKE